MKTFLSGLLWIFCCYNLAAQAPDSLRTQLEELRKFHPGNSRQEAELLLKLGKQLHSEFKLDEAITTFQQLLTLQQQWLPDTAQAIAYTQYMLGWVHLRRSTYNEAIDWLEKAASRYRESKGETSTEYADVLEKRTQAYLYNGRYTDALADAHRLLALRKTLHPANHSSIAKASGILGTQYKYLKKYPEAIRCFQDALDIYHQAEKINHNDIAACYSEIGQIFLYQKDFPRALATFQREDSIMISGKEHLGPDYAYTCSDFGKYYLATGNYPEALRWQEKSINIINAHTQSDNTNVATLYLYLGRTQAARQQFPEALASFETDARMLGRLHGASSSRLFHCNGELGFLYLRWYQQTRDTAMLHKSQACFRTFESDIDYQMQAEILPEAQQKLRNESARYFERAILTELEVLELEPNNMAAREKAWQLSEKMHSFMLLAATTEARARHFAGIPDDALAQDLNLNDQWVALDKKRLILTQYQNLSSTDSAVQALDMQIAALKANQARLWRSFEVKYPEYYQLKYGFQPASLKEIQQHLKPQQTLLEYFVGDSTLYLFEITAADCLIHRIAAPNQVQQLASDFLIGLTAYHTAAAPNPDLYQKSVLQYAQAAYQLYQTIWKPIADRAREEIILVPGEWLSNLPFEALLSTPPADPRAFSTYPFLVKKHHFQYAYSASMWLDMQRRKHQLPAPNGLLALAPFCYNNPPESTRSPGNQWSALPFSDEEVSLLQHRFTQNSKILLGKDAAKSTFIQQAAQYRILHLATHGKSNPGDGDQCYLALAANGGAPNAELLTAAELYNLPIKADLVVLSACETGIGEQLRGEGVRSLARAFAYAGAKSIVASLWRVSDQSTMQIMDAFYAGLKAGKSKHVALGEAKRKYLQENPGKNAHPFFWAAFVGLGDEAPID
ncbi:MAG TPA: CHAT domain-containing tetratricopeptide repeat protein [Saprospiraceae bacterium]|nr:CHAT domain-containing tetratricopeptide repeat protein [Saprospiraceae bacterium]